MEALPLIQERVKECERQGISILCCPEAVLGGLADYSTDPYSYAIATHRIQAVLAPLTNETVTAIVGFTEIAGDKLYNAAAAFHRGRVLGLYRKHHPAIRTSVYCPGTERPVFRVGEFTFGVVICNDSNFTEPAARLAEQGATALFIPTNNGLPLSRAHAEVVCEAREADIARARSQGVWVIRADVAGTAGELQSYGSTAIVDPTGHVVATAATLSELLAVADVTAPARPSS